MVFENVHGAVDVRNQAVHLKKLTMRGLDADIDATLVYRARRKSRGYAGFDFKLHKINIGKLGRLFRHWTQLCPCLVTPGNG